MELEHESSEQRVLGCLIEKGITTPDYYPMTLNALTAACNQKSNREPVVDYDEKTVVRTLDSLREKELVRVVSGSDMRVPKYYHRFTDVLGYTASETAVLCELLLRGPQTPGELRGRGSRMYSFSDLAEVESVLTELIDREAGQAVVVLPRQPGTKEARFAHTLGGMPDLELQEAPPEPARLAAKEEDNRMQQLEQENLSLRRDVDDTRRELRELQTQFAEFRRQFE